MNKLFDICCDIAEVEEKLYYGEIQFSYGKLEMAMKAGHPADILDSIIAPVFWKARDGKDVSKEEIENLIEGLNEFQKAFKVNLKPYTKELTRYKEENYK